jgi:hypothetical protein
VRAAAVKHSTTVSGWIQLYDLCSDIAAELRARDLYFHLANAVADPGSRDTLLFLGNREEAHAASFARALESIKGTIELPKEWFKHPYVNSSPGTYKQWGFHQDRPRVGANDGCYVSRIAGIDVGGHQPEPAEDLVLEAERPAVDLVAHDQVVAGVHLSVQLSPAPVPGPPPSSCPQRWGW